MKKTKLEILNDLQKLGWEYIIDEFTCSEYGHRRERFEKVVETKFDEQKIFNVETALIFHYLWNGKHDAPHIQTYRSKMYYGLNKAKEKALAFGNACCSLEIKEMQLFLDLMKLISKEDKLLDKGGK